jgi:hypothetical protein
VSDHSVKSVAIVLQILCGKLSRFATVFSRIAVLQSLHLRTMSAVGRDTSKGILLPFFDGDGLNVTDIDGKVATRYEHWCGRLPKWIKHLRTWGECGTVKVKNDTTPKIADR